eukprot:m.126446 g.126446  ORF g.126446 m.126446 type:complete len:74 (-) comp23502_c0_seq4:104-325(-)
MLMTMPYFSHKLQDSFSQNGVELQPGPTRRDDISAEICFEQMYQAFFEGHPQVQPRSKNNLSRENKDNETETK